MQKRKLIVIGLMLGCTLVVTLSNWDYWQELISGPRMSSGSSVAGTPAKADDPQRGVTDAGPQQATRAGTAATQPAPPVDRTPAGAVVPASSGAPQQGAGPTTHKQGTRAPQPGEEFSSVMKSLEKRLEPEREDGTRAPARPDRFHHPLEVIGGVRFEDLVQAALAGKDPRSGGALPGATQDTNENTDRSGVAGREQLEREQVRRATLQAIVKGNSLSLCVIDGHRLQEGETYPGTGWSVATITTRTVILSKSDDRVALRLGPVGASPRPAPKGKAPRKPGSSNDD